MPGRGHAILPDGGAGEGAALHLERRLNQRRNTLAQAHRLGLSAAHPLLAHEGSHGSRPLPHGKAHGNSARRHAGLAALRAVPGQLRRINLHAERTALRLFLPLGSGRRARRKARGGGRADGRWQLVQAYGLGVPRGHAGYVLRKQEAQGDQHGAPRRRLPAGCLHHGHGEPRRQRQVHNPGQDGMDGLDAILVGQRCRPQPRQRALRPRRPDVLQGRNARLRAERLAVAKEFHDMAAPQPRRISRPNAREAGQDIRIRQSQLLRLRKRQGRKGIHVRRTQHAIPGA